MFSKSYIIVVRRLCLHVNTNYVNYVFDNAWCEPWFGQNDTVTVLFTQNHGHNSKIQEHFFVVGVI